jgi:hypothetical protein
VTSPRPTALILGERHDDARSGALGSRTADIDLDFFTSHELPTRLGLEANLTMDWMLRWDTLQFRCVKVPAPGPGHHGARSALTVSSQDRCCRPRTAAQLNYMVWRTLQLLGLVHACAMRVLRRWAGRTELRSEDDVFFVSAADEQRERQRLADAIAVSAHVLRVELPSITHTQRDPDAFTPVRGDDDDACAARVELWKELEKLVRGRRSLRRAAGAHARVGRRTVRPKSCRKSRGSACSLRCARCRCRRSPRIFAASLARSGCASQPAPPCTGAWRQRTHFGVTAGPFLHRVGADLYRHGRTDRCGCAQTRQAPAPGSPAQLVAVLCTNGDGLPTAHGGRRGHGELAQAHHDNAVARRRLSAAEAGMSARKP